MKRILFTFIALLAIIIKAFAQLPEGFSTYTLDNGLTVYLWEDHDQPDVYGFTVTRAGSLDEPETATGLAHYLEHMLFKGTDKIGALDWEKEKPYYEQILSLYDELAQTQDEKQRVQIQQKINEASLASAQYTATDEFSNLVQGIGGEGLNAFTSYDMTVYLNTFPSYEMERWLTLYSDRLINPVFRSFQAELENVFEEYNMYQDDNETHVQEFVNKIIWAGHPYSRDIIGYPEDLKNPKLRQLINFYNTWYVANNMALILVGNFNTEEVRPLIEKTFSRLESKPLPERKSVDNTEFSKNESYTARLADMPESVWVWKGIPAGHEDEQLLDFALSLLSNDMSVGLLDRLAMNGKVMYAVAASDTRRDGGRVEIAAVPMYDPESGAYINQKSTKQLVEKEIENLINGNFADELLETVRESYRQDYELLLEHAYNKTNLLISCFAYNQTLEKVLEQMQATKYYTKEDVMRIAKKYLSAPHMYFDIAEGNPKKDKLSKPKIKPLDSPIGTSAYYEDFQNIPSGKVQPIFCDFTEVDMDNLYRNIHIFSTKNTKNDIFSIRLKYGVGTKELPLLKYAVPLMNLAGLQGKPGKTSDEFRMELAQLGGKCSYSVDDSWMYVDITGNEDKLAEIISLVNLHMLFPDFSADDNAQLNRIKGMEYSQRTTEKKNIDMQASAFSSYVLYGNRSTFVDRPSMKQVLDMTASQLSAQFHKALNYELEIHYVGKLPADSAKSLIIDHLPMQDGATPTNSPVTREREQYDKPMIFFLPNRDMQQAKVWFFVEGQPYSIEQDVDYMAFNEYFDGSFSGIIMNEIREKRSMAYTATGRFITPQQQGRNTIYYGYVGTQSDKVADVVDVYLSLVKDMPQNTENTERIKTYLRQSVLSNKPSMRRKSETYASWMRFGYKHDPAITQVRKIRHITFESINQFYKDNLQGKNIVVAIMGDPKLIDIKSIESKYGKTKKIAKEKIFSPMDL
ncbi:MAG: insulinase family protein [Paludibacteraceae bacterium]|nr:insulinase family protein [Paludibacteraceae bacterium]